MDRLELLQYIRDSLGVDIELFELSKERTKTLPLFISGEYKLYLATLYRKEIILAYTKNSYSTETIGKQLEIVRKTFNTLTVAVLDYLESYNRKRLIEKKIPFIIPGKQMYMPDLLIDLKEFGVTPKNHQVAMSPATQMLLLYHMQVESLENMNLKSIAEKLHFIPMTITRAAYYLYNIGLCTLKGSKDKFLHFETNGRELWNKAEPLMNNPIKKSSYFSGWTSADNLYRCNINALSHYTDIGDEVVDYFATRPGYTSMISGANLKQSTLLEANICIEEWKYDPYFLTKDKYVDPLSLYLCFRGKPNERIEVALDQLIENVKW